MPVTIDPSGHMIFPLPASTAVLSGAFLGTCCDCPLGCILQSSPAPTKLPFGHITHGPCNTKLPLGHINWAEADGAAISAAKNITNDHLLNIMMGPYSDCLSVDWSGMLKLTVTDVKTISLFGNIPQD